MSVMDGVDPDTLLEWLQTGVGDERDIQMMALEQLCMLLLMSDNIDRCFESCPPRTFLPALCKIFLDESATENVLEVTARAITYYLDVSNECTRRITQVDGAVKAICNRLAAAEMTNRTSKDLAEQCVKLLEHICQRETSAVYDAGGLQCMLSLVTQYGQSVHKDTMHSAMSVVTRLCSKMEPADAIMPECSASLGALLGHDDPKVSECALRCFAALTDRFIRKSLDPVEMARHGNLVEHLLSALVPLPPVSSSSSLNTNAQLPAVASSASILSADSAASSTPSASHRSASFTSIVISLLSNLCRGSSAVTEQVISSSLLIPALRAVLASKDERCVMDTLRLCDLLVVLLCEGRHALPRSTACSTVVSRSENSGNVFERSHRHLIDAIRQRDTDALIDAVESGQVDANFTDDVGQTLLNWSSAFGTVDMVTYLCDKGADVNKGQRSSSLHYAACFGRPDVVKILLRNGANPDLRDEEGKTALDKARERSEEGHQQVAAILESPSSYMHGDEQAKCDRGRPEEGRSMTNEAMDPMLVRSLLEQLLPLLCDVFQRSLGASVRRSTVSLLRKTTQYMSPESLSSLVTNSADGDDISMECSPVTGPKLAENIVNVIVAVLEHEEDIEGHEHVLHLMKALFAKEVDFWLEQLIRVGVFEKVEAIATQPLLQSKGGMVTTMVVDESGNVSSTSSMNVTQSNLVKAEHRQQDETSANRASETGNGGDETVQSQSSATWGTNRSNSSTPSLAAGSLSVSDDSAPTEKDNDVMLNVPIHVEGEEELCTAPSPAEPETAAAQTVADTQRSSVISKTANATGVTRKNVRSAQTPTTDEMATTLEDRWEIVEGRSYRWKDWRLVKSRDSLFIWCDAVAMEFSDGSNGWFRFMLDGQLSTMYSSGSPESGADSAETRGEFVDKLTKARSAVPPGSPLNPIFTLPNSTKSIDVGNWVLASPKVGELTVTNRDGNQQRMLIMEDLPGFIFESNRQTKHCFQAESTLGLDFVTGWAARGGGRRLRFRAEAQKAKLQELAKELWENYMKEARSRPRDALVELQRASSSLQEYCASSKSGNVCSNAVRDQLQVCLRCMHEAVTNERVLSTFELSISGLVSALLSLLEIVRDNDAHCDIAVAFRKVFADGRSLSALVRKMVLVLETVEKFPQYLYDTPGGSSFGLQLLSRRIKLKLEHLNAKSSDQKQLLDRTGRTMKTEPLTTVGQLKNYILRMVAKQWYDRDRETFAFVRQIKDARRSSSKISFVYSSDFDDQGLIYWLGTNGKTFSHWTNPASVNVVYVTSSDGARQPYGHPEDILSRDVSALNCHTSDDKNAHFTIDLGVYIYPTSYTLRHARGYGRSALRNWLFQGSRNGRTWDVLLVHENDAALSDPGSTATWPVVCAEGKGPYRYLRIAQNGKNASNQTYYLSLSGFEVYGNVVDVVVDDLKPCEEKQSATMLKGRIKRNSAGGKEKESGAGESSGCTPSESAYSHLPGGAANNKVTSGVVLSDMTSASSALKTRILRYRRGSRGSRLLVGGRGLPTNPSPDAATVCSIGCRVTRGPDWKWENQGNGTLGTVISSVEDGWVDVQWDDKTSNSYRFGADGRFDVEVKPGEAAAVSAVQALRRVPRGLVASRREHIGNVAQISSQNAHQFAVFGGFTPLAGRQLPPAPRNLAEEGCPQKAKWTPSGLPFSRFHQNVSSRSNVPFTDAAGTSREAKAASASPAASSTIAQKSMSTTNLLDGSEGEKRPSVASTNQAASAESLQHQTPSLENLLARSRIFDERIPEVVADDGSLQETPLGSSRAMDTDQESVSTNNNPGLDTSVESFDAAITLGDQSASTNVSVGASTRAGGSQPSLSGRDGTPFEGIEQRDTRSSPRESLGASPSVLIGPDGEPLVSIEQVYANNLPNLSVSAPDLVLLRRRQQGAAAKDSDLRARAAIEQPDGEEQVANINDDSIAAHPRTAKRSVGSRNTAVKEITNAVDDAIRQYLMGEDHSESLAAAVAQAVHVAEQGDDSAERLLALAPTPGAYNEFLDAYADILGTGEEESGAGGNEKKIAAQSTGAPASSDASVPGGANSGAASAVHRNVQSVGGGIRSRLGSYADVLRTMMQQVIDSGASLNALELEELEDDIYEEDMTEEGNEEDCDDEYVNGLSVEALAQAAAALRRQSSTGSTSSNGELKLNWKQIVMGEAGRLLGERTLRSSNSTEQKNPNGGLNRNWDDEFVLKRQFAALIPAFDPRPGRTNVNQTQDVELPPPTSDAQRPESSSSRASSEQPRRDSSDSYVEHNLRLHIRGPNLANINNVTVELDNDDASVFYFLQQLGQNVDWGQKTERTRRVWEPTYTLIYEEASGEKSSLETVNDYIDDANHSPRIVLDTLAVLANLHKMGEAVGELEMSAEMFISEKLTQKLMQELADPLVVAARALPRWCDHLIYEYPCLFSVETRTHYLHATAFGTSRAIVWLQTRRDQILEQSRGATSAAAMSNLAGARRDDHYPEFRVGRIKHERIKVPRNGEQLFEYASRVMNFHASRKSVLELEYVGEEGTGLGPTLEFYALVAAEFQRKSLGMWICDDADEDQLKLEESELDLGEGMKPPGYYVRRAGGLFPAPLPRFTDESRKAAELFRFLGIFLAKVLQDGRLVDLPLSRPFLKLLVAPSVVENKRAELKDVLTLDDLEEVSPMKGRVLKELSSLVHRKRAVESDEHTDRDAKRRRIENLTLIINGNECRVEDLSLSFSVNPPSSVFTYGEMELIEGGSNMDVTNDNVDLYIDKCTEFYLNTGICDQINAFREGFDLVFPLRSLRMFAPEEVQTLLSGEQCPEWTREDIINHTEPKLGYTRESAGFLRFVDVLVGMNSSERKSFLQFTTGCSSLPPGGLANLHPRLTIVRKVDSGDGSYPSVNTCVHYLKLPDYSSTEIMRERLLMATNEKGFYLN
uniref:E3 ubiquitin-protein ligase n=10 Tax=Parascaris univalens TaxID=6257 RepID=A0A914ZV22_PARUN